MALFSIFLVVVDSSIPPPSAQSAAEFAQALSDAASAGSISDVAGVADVREHGGGGGGLWCPMETTRELEKSVIGVAVCTAEFAPCSLCHDARSLIYSVTAAGEVSFLLDEAKQVSCLIFGKPHRLERFVLTCF